MSESQWIERAQVAEARLTTMQESVDRLKEKYRTLLQTLGAKERSDGTVDIDFEALVERLSAEHALELRAIIDQTHCISGAPGEKPRISVTA